MKTPLIVVAFPTRLVGVVRSLAPLIDQPASVPAGPTFLVNCDNELLHLPERIYSPVISDTAFNSLEFTERCITACWFTRHHDGHVREKFLRSLPAYNSAWIVAYVVALCGEYVLEILVCIWEHRLLFDLDVLGTFLRDNAGLYHKTRSRIVSYWDCYYRHQFPIFEQYVGSHLLFFFDECLARPSGKS
jgi:hypothetical protein